jgi:RNA polymerase sigma-70 factor (ECF subfamily)
MNARERQAALDRARQGDGGALGAVLESFRPYLRVLLLGLGGGRLRARLDDSDLVQEAFLEAHREFPSFRGATAAELAGWLRRIALRTAGKALRRHLGAARRDAGRERPLADGDGVAATDEPPDARAERVERAATLAAALARLPQDMQQVLLGRHVEDLPYAVLAERLGRGEAALRVLYSRALRRLRDECREHEP